MKKRYDSLDIMRGLTVAAMIVVNNSGSRDHVFAPLKHSVWEGCTPTDLIFPFFLFCVGVAMAFSLSRYVRVDGSAAWKILKRGLIIFLLGIALKAFPFYPVRPDAELTFGQNYLVWLSGLRIPGVLQRIALCYVAGSFLVLLLRKTNRIVGAVLGLSAIYTTLMLVFGREPGPFTLQGNMTSIVDEALVGSSHMFRTYVQPDGSVVPFDPEGLVSSISALCNVLIGYLAGMMIRRSSDRYSVDQKAVDSPLGVSTRLFSYSALCLALAMVLSIWIPIIKKLWTTSFMLYTSGWALFVLALLVYLVDYKRVKGVFMPFKALGMNPLALYCLSILTARSLTAIFHWNRYAVFGANEYMSLLYSLIFVSVYLLIAVVLYKKKIFIKI